LVESFIHITFIFLSDNFIFIFLGVNFIFIFLGDNFIFIFLGDNFIVNCFYLVFGFRTLVAQIPSDLLVSPDPLLTSHTAVVTLDVGPPFSPIWAIDIKVHGVSYLAVSVYVLKILIK